MKCHETTLADWQRVHPNNCYFYPMRDCPGWEYGKMCSRLDKEIPNGEAEQAQNGNENQNSAASEIWRKTGLQMQNGAETITCPTCNNNEWYVVIASGSGPSEIYMLICQICNNSHPDYG